MKRLLKQVKWLSAILLIATTLTACGKPNAQSEEKPSENKEKTTSEVTEISFVSYSNYEAPLKKVIEEFEKENPTIKVKLELSPFKQLMETIEIKMGAKSKDVDVLFVDSPLTMNYTLKGYLEPLDELLGAKVKEKWVKSAIDTASYKGKLMSAPMNNSSQVLYYNKDIFKEKGVEFLPEDKRLTWEEIVKTAQNLTYDNNGDGQTDVFGFSFDQIGRPYQLLALSDSLGAKMLSKDGLKSAGYIDSPKSVQAFEFYSDLFNKLKVSPKIKREESIDYFTSGKVAMFLGANHNLPKLKESGINFGVALHPYFKGGKVATPTGAWNVGISKYSEKKEAAAEFIKFLTYGEGAKIMFTVGGTLPAHTDILDEIEKDPTYAEFPNKVIRIAAKESRETAIPRPKSPGYLEWESNINQAFEDIKNGSDPKQALEGAAVIIDKQLEKYKGAVK